MGNPSWEHWVGPGALRAVPARELAQHRGQRGFLGSEKDPASLLGAESSGEHPSGGALLPWDHLGSTRPQQRSFPLGGGQGD